MNEGCQSKRAMGMSKLVRLGLVFWTLVFTSAVQAVPECVVLLHGLGRGAGAMGEIEDKLLEQGYSVWNDGYASREADVATLAQQSISEGLGYCEEFSAPQVHFVTHSLGGILVRQYLQHNDIAELGKIVMLAPPNHGSEVSDYLKQYDWFESLIGPVGPALSTAPDSVPNSLKPIPGVIGIITGDTSLDPWFSWMFNGPNDGKVSVASARLDEMADFLVVDHGHTFIARGDDVIDQIQYFLQHGKFSRELLAPSETGSQRRQKDPVRVKR